MTRFSMTAILFISATTCGWVSAQSGPLVVHEWGTFTSLEDESGHAIGGINEDVEPLPSFVKSIAPVSDDKGLPSAVNGRTVTMRLETPVVYFHPAPRSAPQQLTFSAEFHGGLITQYYPAAEAEMPATANTVLNEKTIGKMTWKNITIGSGKAGPVTSSPVWLAPRNVNAADITSCNGQSERYLFYRGVAHLDSPLKVIREGNRLRATLQTNLPLEYVSEMYTRGAWLLDIRPDSKCAYRKMQLDNPMSCAIAPTSAADFQESEYGDDRIAALRHEMKAALTAAGLFDDEADAMLNTWQNAYFKSPGTRVFFLVPSAWTNEYLPITLSVPAQITRVMVGRIDLVTPKQRELARQYAKAPNTNLLTEIGRFAKPIVTDTLAHAQ